jgi:hypothetical protein
MLPITGGRSLDGGAAVRILSRERMAWRERERQKFKGLNTLGSMPSHTLSSNTGHCPDEAKPTAGSPEHEQHR